MATPTEKTLVTLIPGDGVGPECVDATRAIIEAAKAPIEWEVRHAGASIFKQGLPSGVPQETIDSIKKTRVVLKGPLETPIGFGEKSANVTLRKLFETYGNIRPVRELPGVQTPYSGRGVDLVIVRENVEDLYAGIEYMQTPGVAECLKLISRKGCEKIVRLAFELAKAEGRKKVHCASKSNIMKFTEGLLKKTFEEIAPEYPEFESQHIIIDNCAHQLVKKPEQFDVIVTTNMNGDIISDLSSALIGGLGFAPSANLGSSIAIFEAVHGSAPKYAGKDVINPLAVLFSALMMLRHLKMFDIATNIEHAIFVTMQEGKYMPRDVVGDEKAAGTKKFTEAIIANLGKRSSDKHLRNYKAIKMPEIKEDIDFVKAKTRETVGVDLFIESALTADQLGKSLQELTANDKLKLKMVSNRGTKVFPDTGTNIDCVDQWFCRFVSSNGTKQVADQEIFQLLEKVGAKYKWMHIEKLQEFDGKPGFTKAQGED